MHCLFPVTPRPHPTLTPPSESNGEQVKLKKILLNGNNICMVSYSSFIASLIFLLIAY